MKHGWQSRAFVALLGVAALSACGDGRLKKLSAGISKDSVAVLMKTDAHSMASYATGGKLWEIQFYTLKEVALTDSVDWRAMSPVVFADGKVSGWGWNYWEKEAAIQKIPVPPKQ